MLGPDQGYDVAHRPQLFAVSVRYLNVEFVFQQHDGLDHVETCDSQVVNKVCRFADPPRIDAELGRNQVANSVSGIDHGKDSTVPRVTSHLKTGLFNYGTIGIGFRHEIGFFKSLLVN